MPLKILYAEDDENTRTSTEQALKCRGHEVTAVENGRLLLEELRRNPSFDLILTDNQMPEVIGLRALYEIRQDIGLKHLAVIVFTGDNAIQKDIEYLGGIYLDKNKLLVSALCEEIEQITTV